MVTRLIRFIAFIDSMPDFDTDAWVVDYLKASQRITCFSRKKVLKC